MFYKISPTVNVWLSKTEREFLKVLSEQKERTILRSALKQEQLLEVNRLVSKSILWRKKIGDDVLYGKKKK
jgi:hypothetical protein